MLKGNRGLLLSWPDFVQYMAVSIGAKDVCRCQTIFLRNETKSSISRSRSSSTQSDPSLEWEVNKKKVRILLGSEGKSDKKEPTNVGCDINSAASIRFSSASTWSLLHLFTRKNIASLLHSPRILILLDTRADLEFSLEAVPHLGFSNHYIVLAVDQKGGIWFLWDNSFCKIDWFNSSDRTIHAVLKLDHTTHCVALSATHMPTTPHERQHVWYQQRGIIFESTMDVTGDLNVAASPEEKQGGSQPVTNELQQFMESSSLMDLGYIGHDFTWNNGQEPPFFVQERLDRVLVNQEFNNTFPEAMVENIAPVASDHTFMKLALIDSIPQYQGFSNDELSNQGPHASHIPTQSGIPGDKV